MTAEPRLPLLSQILFTDNLQRQKFFTGGYVPDDARRELTTMREAHGLVSYIKRVWTERNQGKQRKSHKGWPFVPLEQQSNVTRLKTRSKSLHRVSA